MNAGGGNHEMVTPMFGLGFGLPSSRSIAKYFGGSIELHPLEGWGTDTYIRLNTIGNIEEQVEL